MITWSCKAFIAGGLCLSLAACDETTGLNFAALGTKPVTEAVVAKGAVTVAAPRGYCVDPRRIRSGANQSTAVMARCDRLGQDLPGTHSESLAVIMVTTIPLPEGTGPMKARALEAAQEGGTVDRRRDRPDIAMIRIKTDTLAEQFDPHVWRGAFRVNGQLIGTTLYAQRGSAAAGNDGADLLEDLARRTRRATDRDQSFAEFKALGNAGD